MTPIADLEPPPPRVEPRLAWVEVRGKMCHVSDFAGIPPAHRPTAHCPACRGTVTLKLGALRAHHAAHRPDSICDAARGRRAAEINERYSRTRRRKAEENSQEHPQGGFSPHPADFPNLPSTLARVHLIGHAGRDPEVFHAAAGRLVHFSLATHDRRTDWHRIVAPGEEGRVAEQVVHKGLLLFVEGDITHRSYVDRDGGVRSITEIVAHTVLPLP